MDAKLILEQYQDYLAPRLDTYEQAIYLYLLRHGRFQGHETITVGFKSARRRMAFGIGSQGTPMSEGTCYRKLRSLEAKRCLEIQSTERDGTRIRLRLPSEIDGVIQQAEATPEVALEDIDFFGVPENRTAILRRENHRCFYCLRALESSNHVIEHVTSRPAGNNSYRNVVAACRNCNNKKGDLPADDYLRDLYRGAYLGAAEFEERLAALQHLVAGELRPELATGNTRRRQPRTDPGQERQ